MKGSARKRILSIFLAVLMAVSGVIPAMSVLAGDGVEGYYDLEIFYGDTGTIVPTYGDDGESAFNVYMVEGEEKQFTYNLIDSEMPDNGYIKWYSENPVLVDTDQTGLVKAFDSSKGAVVQAWIDNEVKTIPIIGKLAATVIEKALFNEYVDLDSMDTEEICDLVIAALGSDSILADQIEAYQGELVDSLRQYLDNINSNIHCQLYSSDGTLQDDDVIHITVTKNEEWYANFLPNGTHITNKSQINTTQAVGNTVQLYAITTPQRLGFGTVYSVKSSSIFTSGKVVATVDDSGLVTFKNKGTVTIVVSPDSEEVIEALLKFVNYFYELENTGTLDTTQIADILIKYMGVDMNRTVLAAILDACFAIKDIAQDAADPVQLTATAVEVLANIILQMAYNDTITFTVEDAVPITDFKIDGMTSVKEGNQIKMNIVDVQPSTGNTGDITWKSSDPTIACVDEKTGVITGLDAGGSLGQLSSQTCVITATSAANNVQKSVTITVTGKTGKYLSGVFISGADNVMPDEEVDYSYIVYPQRVAESDNLYITWGIEDGVDESGNPTYIWANDEEPATDGIGTITSAGHYTPTGGGICTIAVKAVTGYYLSNGSFYEISSRIGTKKVTNGIPVEKINVTCTGATSNGDLNRNETVNINGKDYQYITIHKGVMEGYAGNGAIFNAEIVPANASNKNVEWVTDNSNYSVEVSDETHTCTVKQKAGHEVADTFNVYAVSQDGEIVSNVITVCVTRNYTTGNVIDQITIDMINGKTAEATHTVTFDGSWTGEAYACYKANWYSSDESVFSVQAKSNDNCDAVLTGNDVGTATLYCVTADGGIVDTCQVKVKPDKEYLQNIVDLCENTVILRTDENKKLYQQYMRKLDLAYYVLYDEEMASQDTCDTYARELLTAFYKLGGFVGIGKVKILGKNGAELDKDYVTVSVSSTTSYKKYSYDFDLQVSPKNAMYKEIKWTSSNDTISVDQNGICKPTSNDPCSAQITCTVTDYMDNECSDTVNVAFARTKATGVTLDT
ncbi:MAG: Ig-like domain-containing protein, partial [Eubacterium sp.]